MTSKPVITSILAVTLLLSASGTIGSFYFVSSQGQTTTEPTELTLSESEASPGSVIEVEGINFGANSQVSIYFMSAEEADLTDGSAFILQGIDANQSTTIEPEDTSTFFDADGDALHTLGDLLELSTDQGGNDTTITTDTTSISEQNLLVVLEEGTLVNGTMSLECEDVNIAQGRINGTVGTFGVSPGTYNECSISISDADITDTAEIEELIVVSDSEEDYENSLVISETANEEGTFESSVTVPNVEEGEYAILAVADDRRTAVSALSVTVAESVTEPGADTSAANATEGIIMNETIIPAPEEEELAEEEPTELLTAEIISNATEGIAPATFEFQSNPTGGTGPYTYLWDFGDGSEGSDEQSVAHTFEEAGIYNVTLAATDTDNQNASDSIEINVEAPPPITEPLTAEIISNATEGIAPATFEFQSNPTGGTGPYTINWDFGDGSEGSDEQSVAHTFEEADIYNVVVTVTDENGQEASNNLEITVNEPPSPPPITEPLTAEIISNATEGIAPATFEFQSNPTGGTEPYTYLWDFGDGSEGSDEQSVAHTFEEAGIYNVTLAATDTDNQNASDSIEINVEAPPPITEPLTAKIISNATEGIAPATFEFQSNPTGGTGPYTINWDFGDGSEGSDEQSVAHTFEEADIYNVVVTVTDENGQEASDSIEINVEAPPTEEEG